MASAGDPTAYIPAPLSDNAIHALLESISLPKPTSIAQPNVTAQYHSIYVLGFETGSLTDILGKKDTIVPDKLVLRVAGRHLPKIKTENEAATIAWLQRNSPSVPVPAVVRYDSNTNNPLGFEYLIHECASGTTLSDFYEDLKEDEKRHILSSMLRILTELHRHEFSHVGGFKFEGDKVVPGPVLEETFWQEPDIEECWSAYPTANVASLNIAGPFGSYVEYISAHVQKYIFAIKTHDSLAFMRDDLPRIEGFVTKINQATYAKPLNAVKLSLAHKDLHFDNVMYDRESKKITAILDWEFACVVPYTRWDPAKAFLWSGQMTEESKELQGEDKAVFEEMVRSAKLDHLLDDAKYTSRVQENMQLAQNFLRAIVEVVPRGVKEHNWENWRSRMLENISTFE